MNRTDMLKVIQQIKVITEQKKVIQLCDKLEQFMTTRKYTMAELAAATGKNYYQMEKYFVANKTTFNPYCNEHTFNKLVKDMIDSEGYAMKNLVNALGTSEYYVRLALKKLDLKIPDTMTKKQYEDFLNKLEPVICRPVYVSDIAADLNISLYMLQAVSKTFNITLADTSDKAIATYKAKIKEAIPEYLKTRSVSNPARYHAIAEKHGLYNCSKAAEYLDMPKITFRKAMEAGKIPIPKRKIAELPYCLYNKDDLEKIKVIMKDYLERKDRARFVKNYAKRTR